MAQGRRGRAPLWVPEKLPTSTSARATRATEDLQELQRKTTNKWFKVWERLWECPFRVLKDRKRHDGFPTVELVLKVFAENLDDSDIRGMAKERFFKLGSRLNPDDQTTVGVFIELKNVRDWLTVFKKYEWEDIKVLHSKVASSYMKMYNILVNESGAGSSSTNRPYQAADKGNIEESVDNNEKDNSQEVDSPCTNRNRRRAARNRNGKESHKWVRAPCQPSSRHYSLAIVSLYSPSLQPSVKIECILHIITI